MKMTNKNRITATHGRPYTLGYSGLLGCEPCLMYLDSGKIRGCITLSDLEDAMMHTPPLVIVSGSIGMILDDKTHDITTNCFATIVLFKAALIDGILCAAYIRHGQLQAYMSWDDLRQEIITQSI